MVKTNKVQVVCLDVDVEVNVEVEEKKIQLKNREDVKKRTKKIDQMR